MPADTWIELLMSEPKEFKEWRKVGQILQSLSVFALTMAVSGEMVEQGKPEHAKVYAAIAQAIYQGLPERAKWEG